MSVLAGMKAPSLMEEIVLIGLFDLRVEFHVSRALLFFSASRRLVPPPARFQLLFDLPN
jgi:hypothetical protein